MSVAYKYCGIAAAVAGAWIYAGSAGLATSRSDLAVDPDVAGPAWTEKGVWRTKVQQVFDTATRELTRRTYTIWDPEPSRDLDFVWIPDDPAADRAGKINGNGHLVWRIKGRPTYDRAAVHAEYRGRVRDGRIEGRGAYLDNDGLLYEGEWKAGRMEGRGTLKLPGGDEYEGEFRAGKANGTGRYVDVTGEVYDGAFVNGQRHGRGRTTLPNGRSYVSTWVAGKEAPESSLVRLAQAPGKGLPGGGEDIRIGITVDKRLPDSARKGEPALKKGDLWYAVSNTADRLVIRPDDKRLISMWKEGGDIHILPDEEGNIVGDFGVVSLSKSQIVPLQIVIEAQNRSQRNIQITGAYLDVAKSEADLQPALQLSESSAFVDEEAGNADTANSNPDPLEHYAKLHLENFGWSSAEAVKLRFSFVAPKGERPASFALSKDVGTVEKSKQLDFVPELRSAGVDVKELSAVEEDKRIACRSKNRATCLEQLRGMRQFGSLAPLLGLDDIQIIVNLAGVAEYTWRNNKGETVASKSTFNKRITIGHLKSEAELGEGADRIQISTTPQVLKVDASGYRLPMAFTAPVAAGRTARFSLPIEAPKSSQHQFQVVLQLSDGREFKSRPIELLYYMPRWIRHGNEFYASVTDARGPWLYNFDLIGSDLQQVKGTTQDACHKSCQRDTACKAYTFDNWNRWCFLKGEIRQMRFDPKYQSYLKEGTPPPSRSTAGDIVEPYRGKAFPKFAENSYRIHTRASYEDCERQCGGDKTCVAFTLRRQTQECHLLSSAEEYSSHPDADSGVKRQPAR